MIELDLTYISKLQSDDNVSYLCEILLLLFNNKYVKKINLFEFDKNCLSIKVGNYLLNLLETNKNIERINTNINQLEINKKLFENVNYILYFYFLLTYLLICLF